MITDRLTARILGALLMVLPLVTAVSCFFAAKPEVRSRPGFVVVVVAGAIPLFALGAYFWRRAAKLKE